jgi:hypothetical protein
MTKFVGIPQGLTLSILTLSIDSENVNAWGLILSIDTEDPEVRWATAGYPTVIKIFFLKILRMRRDS